MNLGETIELGYELIQHIGQDSLGEVYEARNTQTTRVVRVTMLRPELSEAKEAAPDFLRDALEAAAIVRARVLPVIDLAWMSDQRPVLMSEMVSGRTAAELLAHEGPLSPEQVATMGVELCRGLAATHARGLFHGALGTDSLLLEPQDDGDEHIRIVDFGLRHLIEATSPKAMASRGRFRAPELDGNAPVDGRADLFSVGVILYELLTGLAASGTTIDGPSLFDPEPLPLVRPELSHEMAELIDRAMAPEPADRLLGVEAMARELAAFASRGFSALPPPPRPRSVETDAFSPETPEGQTVPMSPDVFRSMFTPPPSRPSATSSSADGDEEPLGQPLRVHPPRLDAPEEDELDEDNERPTPSEPAIVAALASATLRPTPEPEGPPPPLEEPPLETLDEEPPETRSTSSTPPAAEVDASEQGGRFLIPAIAGALAVLVAVAASALVWADRHQGEAETRPEGAEESAIVIDLDDLDDDVREVESIAVAAPSAPEAQARAVSAEVDAALMERADGGAIDGGAADDSFSEAIALADAAAGRSESDGSPSGADTTLASAGDGGVELTVEQVEERLERARRYHHMGQPLSCLMFTEGLPRSVEVDSQRVRCLTANRQYNRACRVARRHPDDPWCERWIRHNCRGR